MKLKSTLMALALTAVCAMPAVAQDYSTNYDGKTNPRSDRALNWINLKTEAGDNYVTVPIWTQLVHDVTNSGSVELSAGQEITLEVNYEGSWMHSYFYIDFNKDGFVGMVNTDGSVSTDAANDLIMHSGWLTDYTNDYSCVNGLGVKTDPASSVNAMPKFSIPANAAPGTYRARFKVDWSCVDPKGCTGHEKGGQIVNKFDANGGFIIDFMIKISAASGVDAIEFAEQGGAIYDLMGRKVVSPRAGGIYIQNGRKIVVK